MSEDKSPFEAALDVFVYGPLGLFITVTEEMPKLVEKGRQRLTSQLGMARMMGEMAAPHLQSEAEKLVRGVVDRVSPLGSSSASSGSSGQGGAGGAGAGGGAPAPGAGSAASGAAPAPTTTGSGPAPGASRPAPAGTPAPEPADAPRAAATSTGAGPTPTGTSNGSTGRSADSTHLAIPGYDTLSAMQVVQRLAGLSPEELDAVATYEGSHRGRKTILHRAEQLRSEPAG